MYQSLTLHCQNALLVTCTWARLATLMVKAGFYATILARLTSILHGSSGTSLGKVGYIFSNLDHMEQSRCACCAPMALSGLRSISRVRARADAPSPEEIDSSLTLRMTGGMLRMTRDARTGRA